ncbi:MAG: hypothetical protein KatS3mg115_0754 [Candidatus Poribacteria bacterium]|nr:MAG: hypothetical protein KatS3mg115_0754 [Candidatus Poribacteria bacterium]
MRPERQTVWSPERLMVARPILLVDDDKETVEVLQQVLERDGFRCLAAHTAAEAYELFRTHEVAAALIDFELPDMTGVELIQALKRERPEVPLLLMTGNPSQQVLIEACEAGAYTYLRKPLNLQKVRELLARAVERGGSGSAVGWTEISQERSRSVLVRWRRWIVWRR